MAEQFNCLDQLNAYASYLSARPFINGPRPHPLLWTDFACSGDMLLPQDTDPQTHTDISNLYSPNFNSMYMPVGWTVTLMGPQGSKTYPEPGTTNNIPVLITDFSNLVFEGTQTPIKNNVTSVMLTAPQTISDWKKQMCNNEISTVVGARHLTSYQAGSVECDTYMDGYCSDFKSVGCAPGSLQSAPLPADKSECVCLVEENCLKETFCTPDSTDPNCDSTDAFQEFIPVTCFGKNCSIEGYRWARMQNQRCNITLCQQIIRLVGDDIVVKGGSTMWCGNQTIPVVTPTVSASATPSGSGNPVLPTYAWVLIGVAVLIVAVVIPLSVVLYKRSYAATSGLSKARLGKTAQSSPEFQVVSDDKV